MAEAITKYMDKDGNELTEAEYREIQEMVDGVMRDDGKLGSQEAGKQKTDKTKK